MFSQGRTLLHLFRISILTVLKRRWVAVTSILAVMLVVVVLMGFLALARGFEGALSNAGAANIALLLSPEADTEVNSSISREQFELLKSAPGIAADSQGRAVLSPELSVVVGGHQKTDGKRVNFDMRGILPRHTALRDGFELVEGRMFNEGAAELIVGRRVANDIENLSLGSRVRFGSVNWKVVGVFELQAKLFEAEVWTSVAAVQSYYGRENQYQSVRAKLGSEPDALFQLGLHNANDARLELMVQSEREYFASQSDGIVNLITYVGWPLAIVLSLGRAYWHSERNAYFDSCSTTRAGDSQPAGFFAGSHLPVHSLRDDTVCVDWRITWDRRSVPAAGRRVCFHFWCEFRHDVLCAGSGCSCCVAGAAVRAADRSARRIAAGHRRSQPACCTGARVMVVQECR